MPSSPLRKAVQKGGGGRELHGAAQQPAACRRIAAAWASERGASTPTAAQQKPFLPLVPRPATAAALFPTGRRCGKWVERDPGRNGRWGASLHKRHRGQTAAAPASRPRLFEPTKHRHQEKEPMQGTLFRHTRRTVGRVTSALARRSYSSQVAFSHEPLFQGHTDRPMRLLTSDYVSKIDVGGKSVLQVEPEALRLLASTAMVDIAHLLRPGHLEQLAKILDDPEATSNDRFVALQLLKNANVAAGKVLPGCQVTRARPRRWPHVAATYAASHAGCRRLDELGVRAAPPRLASRCGSCGSCDGRTGPLSCTDGPPPHHRTRGRRS